MKLGTTACESVPRSTLMAVIATVFAAVVWFPGVVIAIVSFNHSNAIPYSLLNHVASELGFPGASHLTWVFNGAVAVGGLALLPTLYALGAQLRSPVGYAAVGYGFGACLAASGIGLFGLRQDRSRGPYLFLQYLSIHMTLADVFFLGWLVTVSLFTCVFCRRWRDLTSRVMAVMGFICCLAATAAIVTALSGDPISLAMQRDLKDPAFWTVLNTPTSTSMLTPWVDRYRPTIWPVALLEWCLIGSMLLWFGMSVVYLLVKARGEAGGVLTTKGIPTH